MWELKIFNHQKMTQPEIPPEPFNSFHLDVGDGHRIYVEESGNPDGLPLIVFHGGPGSYSKPKHRLRYDLDKFRLILFDQRSCGQSVPLVVDNPDALATISPRSLIEDAEKIRVYLGLECWHVNGASWGSVLATLYAITYPEVTASLTLGAFFSAKAAEWKWMADGASFLAPAAFANCSGIMEGATGLDLVKKIAGKITEAPKKDKLHYINVFLNMEYGLELLQNPPDESEEVKQKCDDETINAGMLYAHMIQNHIFADDWNTSNAAVTALRDKSVSIVHGACDTICPVTSAYIFQKAHPHAKLVLARNAAHGADLEGEYDRLYRAELDRLV